MDSVLATVAEIEKHGYRFGNLYLRTDDKYRVNFSKLRTKDSFLYGEGDCIKSCLDHALSKLNGTEKIVVRPKIKTKNNISGIW